MRNFYPYFTNDGSVGLFSPSDDDIYHSTYGAATEAYEKFIFPADLDSYFLNNNEIKILDICFGIGYNSKSFLNYFLNFQKIFPKNFSTNDKILSTYNAQIHTDNTNTLSYNEEIYADNINDKKNIEQLFSKAHDFKKFNDFKIYIKAIDTDSVLAYLSPFIISNKINLPKNYKLPFKNEKISKLLNNKKERNKIINFSFFKKSENSKIASLINYPPSLNIILLNKIIKAHPKIFKDKVFNSIITDKKYSKYFNAYIKGLYKFYECSEGKSSPNIKLISNLHNIYYRYLSKRHKTALNSPLYKNLNFDLKINDARRELKSDTNMYNFIFLDAFTPAKCPCLWTIDFFRLLHERLDNNGMILTYSNSASVRNAFLSAGFYVGKIFNPTANKYTGTIATKNKLLIKNELSEYDLGLMKSRAGIFYRDENLDALNEAILELHKKECESSNLISSSKYIKEYKRNKNEI